MEAAIVSIQYTDAVGLATGSASSVKKPSFADPEGLVLEDLA